MKIILAGILLLVALTSADQPCQTPRRLTVDFNVFLYNIDADKLTSAYDGKMYYDDIHKRLRVDGGHGEGEYNVIQLFEERKQYVITKGKCYVMPVKGTFQDMNIPANASLVNGGRIGTPSDGLFIDRYFGEKDGGKCIATVTKLDCVITSAVALAKHNGTKYISYSSFTDASLELDDSVFEKPEGCKEIGGARARRATGGGILTNMKEIIGM